MLRKAMALMRVYSVQYYNQEDTLVSSLPLLLDDMVVFAAAESVLRNS
jgi:hypothetical protein